jgi:CPA1 family monovalent cation:H+ antiporter
MVFTPFDAAAVLIVLAAVLGYLNHRFLRWPQSVGLTVMGAVASLVVIAVDRAVPGNDMAAVIAGFLDDIDFRATLMDGLLSFLLFAGALHVDWGHLRRGGGAVVILSTVGVVLSTVLVAVGFHLLSGLLGIAIPWLWCFVFGALISPTDPVAVMGVLKRTNVAPVLQATVAGESLFNDGVGIVVFTILLNVATGAEAFSASHAGGLFVIEAGGGVLLGLAIGWVAFRAMRSIDDYSLEVLISLAVVMGGYALARWLNVSGPVAMAVAGLIIGNHGVAHAMSDETRDYLMKFWALIENIMDAALFLLIGLEVVTITDDTRLLLLGAAAIPLLLAVRAVTVYTPLMFIRPFLSLGKLAPVTLIWGGLRGGISIALALSLPDSVARSALLAATYLIVLFSVVIQGGSMERIIAWRSSSGPKSQ